MTNPATIGGAGAAVAIKLLQGKKVQNWVKLTPQRLGQRHGAGKKEIKANYSPSRPPTYSARLQIKPWTTYTTEAAVCLQGAVTDLSAEGGARAPSPGRTRPR